jgi:hypothetical protein
VRRSSESQREPWFQPDCEDDASRWHLRCPRRPVLAQTRATEQSERVARARQLLLGSPAPCEDPTAVMRRPRGRRLQDTSDAPGAARSRISGGTCVGRPPPGRSLALRSAADGPDPCDRAAARRARSGAAHRSSAGRGTCPAAGRIPDAGEAQEGRRSLSELSRMRRVDKCPTSEIWPPRLLRSPDRSKRQTVASTRRSIALEKPSTLT